MLLKVKAQAQSIFWSRVAIAGGSVAIAGHSWHTRRATHERDFAVTLDQSIFVIGWLDLQTDKGKLQTGIMNTGV